METSCLAPNNVWAWSSSVYLAHEIWRKEGSCFIVSHPWNSCVWAREADCHRSPCYVYLQGIILLSTRRPSLMPSPCWWDSLEGLRLEVLCKIRPQGFLVLSAREISLLRFTTAPIWDLISTVHWSQCEMRVHSKIFTRSGPGFQPTAQSSVKMKPSLPLCTCYVWCTLRVPGLGPPWPVAEPSQQRFLSCGICSSSWAIKGKPLDFWSMVYTDHLFFQAVAWMSGMCWGITWEMRNPFEVDIYQ